MVRSSGGALVAELDDGGKRWTLQIGAELLIRSPSGEEPRREILSAEDTGVLRYEHRRLEPTLSCREREVPRCDARASPCNSCEYRVLFALANVTERVAPACVEVCPAGDDPARVEVLQAHLDRMVLGDGESALFSYHVFTDVAACEADRSPGSGTP